MTLNLLITFSTSYGAFIRKPKLNMADYKANKRKNTDSCLFKGKAEPGRVFFITPNPFKQECIGGHNIDLQTHTIWMTQLSSRCLDSPFLWLPVLLFKNQKLKNCLVRIFLNCFLTSYIIIIHCIWTFLYVP